MAPFVVPAVAFVVLAIPLVLGVVPPNRFYGVRTQRTLADAATWYAVNRAGGVALAVAGAVYLAVAAVLPYDPLRFDTFVEHLVAFLAPLAVGLLVVRARLAER